MIKIIFPQAIKNVIPSIGNELIALVKETSIISLTFSLLDKIELSRFCLELHSNKANKSDVYTTSQVYTKDEVDEAIAEALASYTGMNDRLDDLQKQIDALYK